MEQEAVLLEALKRGDQKAFEVFVKTHQSKVYNLCLSFIRDKQEADDLSQEVFMECFTKIGQFRGESSLSTWLYRITANKCLEEIRRRKRRRRWAALISLGAGGQEKMEVPTFIHPGVLLENKERAALLFEKIGELSAKQRLAFTLHLVQGLPYQEVAEVMQVSLSSVESLIFRARKNLQERLKFHYEKALI